MASEKSIKRALDLLTISPVSHIESLAVGLRSHTESLKQKVSLKNVVGVGISEKISNKKPTGQLSLTFYVEKKLPLEKLNADHVIPKFLPDPLLKNKEIPTDVIELGKIKPQINFQKNPIQSGYSVGHVRITAGTIGAIVTDGKDFYILSNSHVLALSGSAKKGDKIIYPGKADGGKNPTDLVAKLHNFIPFVPFNPGEKYINSADCAIAKIDNAKLSQIDFSIKSIGVPKRIVKPKRGMKIVKVGRTTGKTEGIIKDVNFTTTINYGGKIGDVGFIDQVLCSRYTEPGDSGSLVIDKATKSVVGLHFAAGDQGSIFNPIGKVLSDLQVSFVVKPLLPKKKTVGKKKSSTVKKKTPKPA